MNDPTEAARKQPRAQASMKTEGIVPATQPPIRQARSQAPAPAGSATAEIGNGIGRPSERSEGLGALLAGTRGGDALDYSWHRMDASPAWDVSPGSEAQAMPSAASALPDGVSAPVDGSSATNLAIPIGTVFATTPDGGPVMFAFGGGSGGGGGDPTPPPTDPPPGGGTGSDPLPVVRISSPGQHADDPPGTPIPDFLQGQGYNAAFSSSYPAPDDTSASNGDPPAYSYVVEKFVWSFPQGAVKGFGTFTTVTGDPDGPHEVFTGGPSEVDGVEVKAVTTFTADDLDYDLTQKVNGEVADMVISKFFLGPEAEGQGQVGVSVTFRKYVRGNDAGTVTIGDTVTINTLKPTGQIIVDRKGTAGVSEPWESNIQFLGFSKSWQSLKWLKPQYSIIDRVKSPNVGIGWTASLTLPNSRTSGMFGVFQTITSSWVYDFTDELNGGVAGQEKLLFPVANANETPAPVNNALDTTFPYSTVYTTDGTNETASSTSIPGNLLKGMDSPINQLPQQEYDNNQQLVRTPAKYFRGDSFVSTLMYNSGLNGDMSSIWVPVAKLSWSWSATAKYTIAGRPRWSEAKPDPTSSVPNSSTIAQANSDFPNWSRNVKSAILIRTI